MIDNGRITLEALSIPRAITNIKKITSMGNNIASIESPLYFFTLLEIIPYIVFILQSFFTYLRIN